MNRAIYGLLLLALAACNTKKEGKTFVVNGTVKNSTASMVYLQESPAGTAPVIIDSARLGKDGSFELEATGKEESIYSLKLNGGDYPFAVLINDSRKITVNADLMNASDPYTVSGSKASQGMIDYDKTTMVRAKEIYNLSRQIDSLQKSGAMDSVISGPFGAYERNTAELKSYTSEFIQNASSPVLALYALGNYQRLSQQLGLQGYSNLEANELITQTADRFPQHAALADLKKTIKPKQAPEFSQPDTSGKAVALSSFKGKYVLVDFWASWCRPCREENPNVVNAFNQYKDKNFTILGVSLDKSREAWLQAIKADGLTWTHVSDLQYWNNAAAALYDVRSIPYNVLLDPNGNIIGENLRGSELEKVLGKVLK